MAIVTRHWGEIAYAPPAQVQGDRVTLTPEEEHHVFRVLRMHEGDNLLVSDGNGIIRRCVIGTARAIEVVNIVPEMGELNFDLSLCVGCLKGDANRDVVDVATQLGVRRVVFVHAERCEGKVTPEKLEKLERVALSAMKQCGRSRLPEIALSDDIATLLDSEGEARNLWLAHPLAAGIPSQEMTVRCNKDVVIVGPEGGFSDHEVELILRRGAAVVDLGGRRLRSLIAVSAALTYILSKHGEIRADKI